MDLIMNQRRNQVFVNHVLMVSRVHCHFPRQEEKGLMNSLVSFSLCGAEYFVTFIDDKSRFVWVYTLKHKSEVFEKFTDWKSMVEKSNGMKVKVVKTDNGG